MAAGVAEGTLPCSENSAFREMTGFHDRMGGLSRRHERWPKETLVTDSFTEIRSVFEPAPSDPFDPQRAALTILWQIPTGFVKKFILEAIYSRGHLFPG